MARIDLSGLDGVRKPTQDEIYKITRYYEHLYRNGERTLRPLIVVFVALGLICIYGYTVSGTASVVIGIIFLAIAVGLIKGQMDGPSELNVFRSGDFIVIPGSVYEIITDSTGMLGVDDVKFMSRSGIKLDVEFRVRLTQLKVGTPLLLIHVDEDKIKHGLTRVFTPFMLSEEGLKGTLF
ncbi:MAG: hypothetical protein LUI87_08125 [Lachnospiraceae bacterium]|nr:hypothetical protein [Lachnospiraceae bacterium]